MLSEHTGVAVEQVCTHAVFTYTVSALRFHRLVQNVVTGLAYKILELDLGRNLGGDNGTMGQWDNGTDVDVASWGINFME